jgi:hypothetical protein
VHFSALNLFLQFHATLFQLQTDPFTILTDPIQPYNHKQEQHQQEKADVQQLGLIANNPTLLIYAVLLLAESANLLVQKDLIFADQGTLLINLEVELSCLFF